MRPTLPSPIARELRPSRVLGLALVVLATACGGPALAPVHPGPPIPADPEVALGTMPQECDAMVAALQVFRACKNLDDDDRQEIDAWIERATEDLVAGHKATQVNANDLRTMARACHRATSTVQAATQRCLAGPRPKAQ